MKKLIASGLAAVLIALSPGAGCYQVLAADVAGPSNPGGGSRGGPQTGAPRVEIPSLPSTAVPGLPGAGAPSTVQVPGGAASVPGLQPGVPGSAGRQQHPVSGVSASPVNDGSTPAAGSGGGEKPTDGLSPAEKKVDGERASLQNRLSNPDTEKSGLLAWIFDRLKRSGGVATMSEVAGQETARASGLAPTSATSAGSKAPVPAPEAPAPKKPWWDKLKDGLDLSRYSSSQKAYLLGQAVFLFGISIYIVSMPLLVHALTGSTANTGIVRMVHYWTLGAASLFSGEIVKRTPMKRVLIGAGAGRTVIFALVGSLALGLTSAQMWPVLLGLAGLNALLVAHNHLVDIDAGGAAKMFPDKADRQHAFFVYKFMRYAMLLVLPWVMGAGLDGLDSLFGAGTGPKAGFLMLAATMGTAAWIYHKKLHLAAEERVFEAFRGMGDFLGRAKEAVKTGWGILVGTPARVRRTAKAIIDNKKVRIRTIMSTVEQFLEDSLFFVVMPTFAVDILGQRGLGNGLVLSATYLGGMLASMVLMKRAAKIERRVGEYRFIVGLSVMAAVAVIPSVGLWAYPSFLVALPLVMVMKFMLDPIQSKMQALLQTAIDEDPKTKAEADNIYALMTAVEVIAAGAGGWAFTQLFKYSGPGTVLSETLGMNAPMKVVSIALAGFAVMYLAALPFLKAQVGRPTFKVHDSPEGRETEALAKLEANLTRMGLQAHKTVTVEEGMNPDRPTVAILAPASVYKLAIAQEGGRQSPGDVHLVLDRSWLAQVVGTDGKNRLVMTKGLYFDKDGQAVLAEYKTPRPVRYFANFYTLGANDRDDGVVLEQDLDVPMSNSVQLEKVTNDKLLTRLLLAAKGIAVPATVAFLMAAHPLKAKAASLGGPGLGVRVAAMPESREEIKSGIEDFLGRYEGAEVVVKPSGPQFHSGRGVKFFARGQVDAMVEHAIALSKDPQMTPDGAVLVDGRLTPPALYLRKGEAADGRTFFNPNGQPSLRALSQGEIASAKPKEKKDWNLRVLAARTPWDGAVTTGIFGRAGAWGVPTTAEPANPEDAASVVRIEDVVMALREQHGLLKTDAEAQAFIAELKAVGANALKALDENEKTRTREAGEPAQAQTDFIGLDVMVELVGGRLVPKIIEVNDHDAGGQWQLDQFYPETAGAHSREWVASMLARARRDAMRGKRVVVVGSGYPNKRFFLETARSLGVEVVLVAPGLKGLSKVKDWLRVHLLHRPSQDNWAKDEVAEFVAVDTTKPEEAYGEALKKLKKSGALNGITTYWEDDVVLTARLAEGLGLPYHPVKTARTARDKALMRDAVQAIDPVAHREIGSHAGLEAAVADPSFPFPAVLKPAMGAEAQFTGVVTREDALRVYDESLRGLESSDDTIFNQSHKFVLEEYLDGHEWDANIVMQDGALLAGSVTDNTEIRKDKQVLRSGEKRQINMKSTGAALPSVNLTAAQQKEALEFSARIVKEIGAEDGVFHVEGKTGSRGPRLLEANLRPGGSYVVHWNKAVTGIDEAEMLFAIAAGIPAVPFMAQEPLRHLKGVFVFSDREGVVRRNGLKPEAEEAGLRVIVEKKPGAKVDFQDNDRVAFVQAAGRTPEEADAKIGGDAKEHLDLHVEDEEPAAAGGSFLERLAAFLRPGRKP